MISVTRKIHIPSVEISFCCAGVSNCSRSARASVWLSNFGLLHRGQRGVIVSLRRDYRSFVEIVSGRRRSRLPFQSRSEEHTSELQSPCNLVCRLLLEKKKKRQSR